MTVKPFLIISYSIFFLMLANALVLVGNHSGTVFTQPLMHRCLSLLLMTRLALVGEGRQEEGSKGQEISFPTIKGVNGVSYFKCVFSNCRIKTCEVYLTFLTKGKHGQWSNAPASLCFLKQAFV